MGATNLGIAFRCRGDPKVLLRSAKLAEASGFSGIWIVEVNDVDAFALAGALSEVTQSIKIASGVVGSSLRLPTLLAMGAITVSEFSTGRFVLGIGAGTPPVTFSGESKSDSPLLRLKETLQSVRGCLETASKKTGPFSFAGQLYQIQGFKVGLPSNHKIPIFSAAMGPKAIEIATEYADGVILMLSTSDYIKKVLPQIDAKLEQRGLSRSTTGELSESTFAVACHITTVVSNDPEQALRSARLSVINYATIPAYRNHLIRQGFDREIEAITAALKSQDPGEILDEVPEEMVRKVIIFGKASECFDKIKQLVKIGISSPIVYPSNSGPLQYPDQLEYQIRSLSPFIQSGSQ
jgi:alkanesulfonate monooxygenase SsuD/methylene tetrahydromethanopterin reductase-like flavin-dependent oxidoreductase (luciferase family)